MPRSIGGQPMVLLPSSLSQGHMTIAFFTICFIAIINIIWLDNALHRALFDNSNNYIMDISALPISSGKADSNNSNIITENSPSGYDVVVVVHHDDMDVLIDWGLQSFQDYLVDFDTEGKIYAIGTPQAVDKLQLLKNNATSITSTTTSSSVWNRVLPIDQSIYPFDINDLKNKVANKPTWNYQQLLKLYAHQALNSRGYKLRRHFLVIDADTVLVNPICMKEAQQNNEGDDGTDGGRWFACIASFASGAFKNDCDGGKYLVKEALGSKEHKAFPDTGKDEFTAICHHMLFDSVFLDELLEYIEHKYKKKPWVKLGSLKKSYLSEYELYLAWLMKNHRSSVAVRQIPYVNWGRTDKESLHIAQASGLKYVTNHDDYKPGNLCYVNSHLPRDAAVLKEWVSLRFRTCSNPKRLEEIAPINCDTVKIDGCKDVNSTDAERYMVFE